MRPHNFEDSDDTLVLAKAKELGLMEGWDKIPKPYAAASLIAFRGNDMWLFKHNPAWEEGWQYDMTVLENYKEYPEQELIMWQTVEKEGGIPRLPFRVDSN